MKGTHTTHWLSLAAAPSFALMAALTASLGGGAHESLCSGGAPASVLLGMIPMYLLMSVFHAAPWWKLICRFRNRALRGRSHYEESLPAQKRTATGENYG
jgi:hypothetical protein